MHPAPAPDLVWRIGPAKTRRSAPPWGARGRNRKAIYLRRKRRNCCKRGIAVRFCSNRHSGAPVHLSYEAILASAAAVCSSRPTIGTNEHWTILTLRMASPVRTSLVVVDGRHAHTVLEAIGKGYCRSEATSGLWCTVKKITRTAKTLRYTLDTTHHKKNLKKDDWPMG